MTTSEGKPLIGLDFGGTTIKGGAVDSVSGAVLAKASRPFDPAVPAHEICDRAASLVAELESRAGRSAHPIGVGCAGLFVRTTGEVLASANMRNLVGTSLTDELRAACERSLGGREFLLENDANVAAFGEQWLGAGRDLPDLVLVTLGTGVGGGVVLGDVLFTGPGGNAGEIGHVVIHPRPGPPRSGHPASEYDGAYEPTLECGCGSYGCLERLVSATAAIRRARARGIEGDLPAIAAAARRSEGPERDLMYAIGRDLGAGLATLVTLFDVHAFAIGGGFGAALDVLQAGAHEVLEERRYGTREAIVRPATLGSDAGWIGAARLGASRA